MANTMNPRSDKFNISKFQFDVQEFVNRVNHQIEESRARRVAEQQSMGELRGLFSAYLARNREHSSPTVTISTPPNLSATRVPDACPIPIPTAPTIRFFGKEDDAYGNCETVNRPLSGMVFPRFNSGNQSIPNGEIQALPPSPIVQSGERMRPPMDSTKESGGLLTGFLVSNASYSSQADVIPAPPPSSVVPARSNNMGILEVPDEGSRSTRDFLLTRLQEKGFSQFVNQFKKLVNGFCRTSVACFWTSTAHQMFDKMSDQEFYIRFFLIPLSAADLLVCQGNQIFDPGGLLFHDGSHCLLIIVAADSVFRCFFVVLAAAKNKVVLLKPVMAELLGDLCV